MVKVHVNVTYVVNVVPGQPEQILNNGANLFRCSSLHDRHFQKKEVLTVAV